MVKYHGILLDTEFVDQDFIRRFAILGQRKSEANAWTAYLVEVDTQNILETAREVQRNLKSGPWYAHFYNNRDNIMVVLFQDKTFEVTKDPENWGPIREYGRSLGIPEDQLTFHPNSFRDEREYRSV